MRRFHLWCLSSAALLLLAGCAGHPARAADCVPLFALAELDGVTLEFLHRGRLSDTLRYHVVKGTVRGTDKILIRTVLIAAEPWRLTLLDHTLTPDQTLLWSVLEDEKGHAYAIGYVASSLVGSQTLRGINFRLAPSESAPGHATEQKISFLQQGVFAFPITSEERKRLPFITEVTISTDESLKANMETQDLIYGWQEKVEPALAWSEVIRPLADLSWEEIPADAECF